MKDPVEDLAGEALIQMAQEISLQLEASARVKPVLYLLSQQRKRAAAAIFALCKIDSHKAEDIRVLQNEVSLYADLIESCQTLFIKAKEQAAEIDEADRVATLDLITDPETLKAIGVEPPAED